MEQQINELKSFGHLSSKLRTDFNISSSQLNKMMQDEEKLTKNLQIFDHANDDLEFITQYYVQEIRNIIIEIRRLNLNNDDNVRPNEIVIRFTLNDREIIIDSSKDDINVS